MAMLLLAPVSGVSAQRAQLEVRAGVVASSTLVEDLLIAPAVAQAYGTQVGVQPKAEAATSPLVELGMRVPVRERVQVSALAGWQPTQLRVQDTGGTRDVQSLALWHVLLEAAVAARRPLFLSAGVGLLQYRSEDEGPFAQGADMSPVLRAGGGAVFAAARHAVTVRVVGEGHRFGTPAVRAAGGENGIVFRYGVIAGVAWGGAR